MISAVFVMLHERDPTLCVIPAKAGTQMPICKC